MSSLNPGVNFVGGFQRAMLDSMALIQGEQRHRDSLRIQDRYLSMAEKSHASNEELKTLQIESANVGLEQNQQQLSWLRDDRPGDVAERDYKRERGRKLDLRVDENYDHTLMRRPIVEAQADERAADADRLRDSKHTNAVDDRPLDMNERSLKYETGEVNLDTAEKKNKLEGLRLDFTERALTGQTTAPTSQTVNIDGQDVTMTTPGGLGGVGSSGGSLRIPGFGSGSSKTGVSLEQRAINQAKSQVDLQSKKLNFETDVRTQDNEIIQSDAETIQAQDENILSHDEQVRANEERAASLFSFEDKDTNSDSLYHRIDRWVDKLRDSGMSMNAKRKLIAHHLYGRWYTDTQFDATTAVGLGASTKALSAKETNSRIRLQMEKVIEYVHKRLPITKKGTVPFIINPNIFQRSDFPDEEYTDAGMNIRSAYRKARGSVDSLGVNRIGQNTSSTDLWKGWEKYKQTKEAKGLENDAERMYYFNMALSRARIDKIGGKEEIAAFGNADWLKIKNGSPGKNDIEVGKVYQEKMLRGDFAKGSLMTLRDPITKKYMLHDGLEWLPFPTKASMTEAIEAIDKGGTTALLTKLVAQSARNARERIQVMSNRKDYKTRGLLSHPLYQVPY